MSKAGENGIDVSWGFNDEPTCEGSPTFLLSSIVVILRGRNEARRNRFEPAIHIPKLEPLPRVVFPFSLVVGVTFLLSVEFEPLSQCVEGSKSFVLLMKDKFFLIPQWSILMIRAVDCANSMVYPSFN